MVNPYANGVMYRFPPAEDWITDTIPSGGHPKYSPTLLPEMNIEEATRAAVPATEILIKQSVVATTRMHCTFEGMAVLGAAVPV